MITVSEIKNDTYHFFSNQISSIFFISIFITFFSILINMFIQPNTQIVTIIENNKFIDTRSLLDLLYHMNIEEKNELFKYCILKIIALLINKTLLLSSVITLIFTVSKNKETTITPLTSSLFKSIPNLLVLNLITAFFVQLGFMFFVIPGVLLSMVLSLAPIILSFKENTLIESIFLSMNICWKNIKIIAPGFLFWICSKSILTIIISNMIFLNKNVLFLISNISMNLLYSLLIIYLFRFYMIFLRSCKN